MGRALTQLLATMLVVLSSCLAGAYAADHARDLTALGAAPGGVVRLSAAAAGASTTSPPSSERSSVQGRDMQLSSTSPRWGTEAEARDGQRLDDGGDLQGEDNSRGTHQHVDHDVVVDGLPGPGEDVVSVPTAAAPTAFPAVHNSLALPPD